MYELLEKNQILNIVPKEVENSNKGKVIDIQERKFMLETLYPADELQALKQIEFFSQTPNGMLYFTSHAVEIKDNVLTVEFPIKHRFLQRRAYSRVKFVFDVKITSKDQTYDVISIDLSAGGMKVKTKQNIDIDVEYDIAINLLDKQVVNCKYQIIKVEKGEEFYTLSGRFQKLSNTDKMKLVQFCMRKSIEHVNR